MVAFRIDDSGVVDNSDWVAVAFLDTGIEFEAVIARAGRFV